MNRKEVARYKEEGKKAVVGRVDGPETAGRETVGWKIGAFVAELSEKYGLSIAQRMFLMLRWRFKTDSECAKSLGLKSSTVPSWKKPQEYADGRKIGNFNDAYTDYFKGFDGILLSELEGLMGKAVQRIDGMLDATKSWIGKGGVEMVAPDYDTVFKGLQALGHFTGRWAPRNITEINNNMVNVSEEFAKLLRRKQQEASKSGIIEGEIAIVG